MVKPVLLAVILASTLISGCSVGATASASAATSAQRSLQDRSLIALPRVFAKNPSSGTVALALAFEEWPLDVMLGDEGLDCFRNGGGHRHGFDQIIARLCRGLAFGRVCRDCEYFVRRF